MHHTRQKPLEQLALPEHDQRLVANPAGKIVGSLDGLRGANETHEEQGAPREERPRDGERRRERERPDQCRYVARTFLSSAVIAGTTSCRLPITA